MNRQFGPEANRMDENRFWNLIDSTLSAADDPDERESLLWDQLVALPPHEVAEFAWIFDDMVDRAEHGNGYEAWTMYDGVGSDDGFHDFRCWLISRGRAVYEATLRDPEYLRPHVTEEESMHWQSFGYVGKGVYEKLTGQECPYRSEPP
jgi:hypothetical protein